MSTYKDYGVLYNWKAAGLSCPAGWHLPLDEEWQTLESFLGMNNSELGIYSFRRSASVGQKLKANVGWRSGQSGNNISKFNALPGGNRSIYWGHNEFFGQDAYSVRCVKDVY